MPRSDQTLADFAEWELDAYAGGESMPQIAAFVAQHPDQWQAWLAQQHEPAAFQQTLYRFDCPPLAQLRDHLWENEAEPADSQLGQHVQNCPACRQELRNLQTFVTPPSVTVPTQPAAPQPTWRARAQEMMEQLRVVVANLVTPPPQWAGATLRGAQNSTLLLLEADGADISLTVEPALNNLRTLAGQVFFTDPPTTPVQLRLAPADPQAEPYETQLDAAGAFVVERLPAGVYQLILAFADRWIVAPQLTLP